MVNMAILGTTTGLLKAVEIVVLLVVMAMFFSAHSGWQLYVSASIIGAFTHAVLLLIIYIAGGLAIQKTLWEVLLNAYNGLMLIISAIVIYCDSIDSVAIASASILLFAGAILFIDMYFALKNTGALSPALGGAAPNSPTGPVSTTSDPNLQRTTPPQPSYPNPLGVVNNNNNTTESYETPPTSPERP